jgi:Na+-transporting NADH:ubiquinone oxidoreductase subunit B
MKSFDKSSGLKRVYADLSAHFAIRSGGSASGATQARTSANLDVVLSLFVVASTPAMIVSAWNAGNQMLALDPAGGRAQMIGAWGLSMSAAEWQSSLVLGLVHIVPLLFVAGTVSLFWAALFARIRGRPIDPGWLMTAWLFVLLIPADLSLLLAGLGISFAAVLGLHIFGGTGRYIVSPAALGALFVQFSYPDAGVVSVRNSWDGIAAGIANGKDAILPVIADTTSAASALPTLIACIAGAAILARTGVISWRLVTGAVLGVALAAFLAASLSEMPVANVGWRWHLALGSLPICLAFVITDPTTSSLSREGRWVHGLMFALLVVAIRVLDPTHPDGSLFAVLLATLSVPLIDYIVVRRNVARAGGRLEVRT